jgi:hypothetical protein
VNHLLAYIAQKSEQLARAPMLEHLRDDTIDPVARLKFAPAVTHFIMSYADMCSFFWRDAAPGDRFETMANANLEEEAVHWKWFLTDLSALGLDRELPFTEAARILWSDQTRLTRCLTYELCRLSAGLASIDKLVLVLAIEATGRVALEAATPAGRQAARKLGRELVYFGGLHLQSEEEHTLSGEDAHHELAQLVLDEEHRARLRGLVDNVFASFAKLLEESLAFGLAEQRRASSA